jgi:hypothetical protein
MAVLLATMPSTAKAAIRSYHSTGRVAPTDARCTSQPREITGAGSPPPAGLR